MTWSIEQLAQRIAQDLPNGALVNLGVGMPLQVGNYLTDGSVILHSENGLFGMGGAADPGQEDPDIVNAGKQNVTLLPGAAITDQADSFGYVRAGLLDLAIIGAYQVSVSGDLANWRRPGEKIAGVGGAVDIAAAAKAVWVMMKASTKDGKSKLLEACDFPLTARGVVKRVYADIGILQPCPEEGAFRLLECAPGISLSEVESAVAGRLLADSPA